MLNLLQYIRAFHDEVPDGCKMGSVFIFFREEIRQVFDTCDMCDVDEIRLERFSNCIFSNLNVTKSFGGHGLGPAYACCIIVIDCDRAWGDILF